MTPRGDARRFRSTHGEGATSRGERPAFCRIVALRSLRMVDRRTSARLPRSSASPAARDLGVTAGRDAALGHPRRRRLFEYICDHPGVHLRALSEELSMGLGVLRLHLGTLRREGFVRSRRTGRRRVYFAWSYRGGAGSSRRERLLDAIDRSQGVTPNGLAREFGVSRMLVSYHVRRLRENGEVVALRSGRSLLLFSDRRWRGGVPHLVERPGPSSRLARPALAWRRSDERLRDPGRRLEAPHPVPETRPGPHRARGSNRDRPRARS